MLGVYYRRHKNREMLFSCLIINIITFLICFVMRKVDVDLGFALGLFAVFGILRYRTEAVGIRDLTYLFAAIGLGIMNATANKKVSVAEVLLLDVVVILVAAVFERVASGSGQRSVLYDNVRLLAPGKEAELREDLGKRTGLVVKDVHVARLDLLRDAAELLVTYEKR
jgi:hypothetical protein